MNRRSFLATATAALASFAMGARKIFSPVPIVDACDPNREEYKKLGEFELLKDAIKSDPEYAWAWHCQIVCAALDEGIERPYANQLAARSMRALFGVDTSTNIHFVQATGNYSEKRRDQISNIQDCLDIQGADGNWNYDPYMLGMFNGIELSHAILVGLEPQFRSAPEQWLADRKTAVAGGFWWPPIES